MNITFSMVAFGKSVWDRLYLHVGQEAVAHLVLQLKGFVMDRWPSRKRLRIRGLPVPIGV